MEGNSGAAHYDGIKNTIRKKRSVTCRRPRPDSQMGFLEGQDHSPPLISTLSDEFSKISSDDIPAFDTNPRRKEFSLSQCMSRAASVTESRSENYDARRRGLNKNMRSTEGVLAPANWKSLSRENEGLDSEFQGYDAFNGKTGETADSVEVEGKVKKVKLKVGGLIRTIHANGSSEDGSSRNTSRPSDETGSRSKHIAQEILDDCNSPQDKKAGLQGISWKDFGAGKEGSAMGRRKQGEQSGGPLRKSKRVPKRRVFDGEFSEEEEDEEIRYLEKLKIRAAASNGENSEKGKSRLEKGSDELDYEEEENELASDNENESKNRKQLKESDECPMENKREITLTTRQRALASATDGSSVIEFPDGLPPAPSRRKKEQLSEVEQQLKKTEAAQRRKLQNEKAARELEAEAIRKVLGQDSSRKKREEKIKKRQEELAQEKAAHEERVATSYIRTIMGPNGTTVSFPEDKLPSLFQSKPVSYPPPREKCVGPSCTNPYRYRDSKTKVPLCSLQCYKAVQALQQQQQQQQEANASSSEATAAAEATR